MIRSSKSKPLVAIACGGTGGHFFPGLAVADELRLRGCDVTILVSPKEVDQEAVKNAIGMTVATLPAVGMTRGRLGQFVAGFWKSYRASRKLFRDRPPQAVLAMGGWGASFYTPTPQQDFDSFIGQAEIKWLITPSASNDPGAASLSLSSLAAGFTRDFADSYIGTYEEINRGYLKFSYMFAGRFLLIVDGGVAAVVYPPIESLNVSEGFTTIRIDPSIFGEYRFVDFFGLNATVRYDANFTDQTVGDLNEPLQWQRFQAFLGARVFW